ncbi:MAG TPA: hypothetical protein VK699_05975 [Terriglobales bacterium]|jgi:hypothetical protein|nr:hypothetical protein [Terriglobales bacterium]
MNPQISTPDQVRRCAHKRADGTQCKAHPQQGRDYCFFHDPAQKKKRAAASRDGGRMRAYRAEHYLDLPEELLANPLLSLADIAAFLGQTITLLSRGEIDVHAATSLGYLASLLLKTMERASPGGEDSGSGRVFSPMIENLLIQGLLLNHSAEPGC